MKIKMMSFIVQTFLFVAAAVAVAPPAALAMGDKVGEFTLPVAVHWGEAVLSPGAYSISANAGSSSSMMCVYKEGSPTVGYLIPAVEMEMVPISPDNTQLVLGEKDGTIYVKELVIAGEGMDFHYAAPKSKK